MTENEQAMAQAFHEALGEALQQHTAIMRSCLESALRWQIANRQMPVEQAEQIIMNTGAALVAALEGVQKFYAAQAESTDLPGISHGEPVVHHQGSVPTVALPAPNGPRHYGMLAEAGSLIAEEQ